jgi:hypothetical protein
VGAGDRRFDQAFGDLDIAEEVAAEAFATAVDHWPADGVPPNLGAWLTATANRKAIHRIRRENKRDDKHPALGRPAEAAAEPGPPLSHPDPPPTGEQAAACSAAGHAACVAVREAASCLRLRLLTGIPIYHARPACQVVPPQMPGYSPYCPYATHPLANGARKGPNLAAARRLIAVSGTRGMRVRVTGDRQSHS